MSRRQELVLALTVASALVLFRSLVFIAYEHAFFDSDQAIVGLMAKHLVEGRAFPLFYYGQTYMLVVDAWVAAPFFLVAGPTVAALHTATTAMNVITAMLLVVILSERGVRPLLALVPVSFFALASPLLGRSFVEAGANIGPLLYVPLLWILRRRPLWFGLVLGLGVLNREFTIYAVIALLAGDVWSGSLWQAHRVRHWLLIAVATVATMQFVQGLKPFSDMMGPGTRGALVGGDAGSQVGNIADRVAIEPREYPSRARVMLGTYLPSMLGAASSDVTPVRTGHEWLFWPLGAGLLAILGRALALTWRAPVRAAAAPGWYLGGVGALAIAAYLATRPADGLVIRYLLLAIFLPVGIVASHVALETRRGWLAVSVVVAAMCAAASAVDHARLFEHFVRGQEPNETRDLANALESRGIHVAESGYWRAYKVSFLTQERVKIASTDVVRIDEYQRLAREAGSRLISISESACAGGERVSLWYLCRP